MFVRGGRETPSVASMRVLRTHRKNSVENFRLQERVKTIDFESQHNYSQISDEIDGVRQNLDKIKGVKRNVGVSVERRKLLRDKGLRILPSKQNGDDHFTVRTSEGKDIVISCTEFYDGNTMRTLKRLSIDMRELKATPCLPEENSDSDEPIDSTSGESRGKRNIMAGNMRTKEVRCRNISPPLRPGSRRNFKDVHDESSENGEKLQFKNISSMQKKCGIVHLKRKRKVLLRPTSRTCPTITESDETTKTLQRKLSRKHSGVAGNSRKTSLVANSVESDKSNEQPTQSDSSKHQVCNDNVVSEDAISLSLSVRPRLRPRLMTTGVVLVRSGISSTTVGSRRMSLDKDKPIQPPPTPSGYTWAQLATSPEPCSSADPKTTAVTADNDNENIERTFSMLRKDVLSVNKDDENSCKLLERKKDNVQDNGSNHIKRANINDDSPHPNGFYPVRRIRIGSSLSNSSHEGRAQSASQPRPSLVRDHNFVSSQVSNGRRSSQDFVNEMRPNKALSKGYVTMQMTIGNKQVKVYVSKFSTGECLDNDVVERARAQSAVKASVGINRPLPRGNR